MPLTIIEINDYRLTISQEKASFNQCGYALINKDQVIFGDAAYQEAKISPSNFYCHYWQRLGYEEIKVENPQVRHFADLAYLQLKALLAELPPTETSGPVNEVIEVIFVVPASYSQEQLSLLLGIAQSCQLTVIAIINDAVIHLADYEQQGTIALVDIGLHHCSYSELIVDDDITLSKSDIINNKGIFDLYKYLANWLNQKFIHECRYDIFATAASEQKAYDQLTEILPANKESYRVTIAGKTIKLYSTEINQQKNAFFAPIFSNLSTHNTLFITDRLATVLAISLAPSLATNPTSNNLPLNLIPIENKKLLLNVIHQLKFLRTKNEISLISQLPGNVTRNRKIDIKHTEISHIVCKGRAYPLNQRAFFLDDSHSNEITLSSNNATSASLNPTSNGWKLTLTNNEQVLINGKPAQNGQQIYLGDHIRLGQKEVDFSIIMVEEALN